MQKSPLFGHGQVSQTIVEIVETILMIFAISTFLFLGTGTPFILYFVLLITGIVSVFSLESLWLMTIIGLIVALSMYYVRRAGFKKLLPPVFFVIFALHMYVSYKALIGHEFDYACGNGIGLEPGCVSGKWGDMVYAQWRLFWLLLVEIASINLVRKLQKKQLPSLTSNVYYAVFTVVVVFLLSFSIFTLHFHQFP